MEKIKIGVQLYTLRKFMKKPENIRPVFERVAKMGADVVQVSGMCKMDSKELAQISKDTNLPICITHSPLSRIQNDIDNLAREHLNYNCKSIGIGLMPVKYRNKENLNEFIDILNTASEKLKKYDMTIAYHNHWFEFRKFGNQTMYDIIIENTLPNVEFIPDTFWMKAGGFEPEFYIDKLHGRINTMHLKDYKKYLCLPVFKAIGDGTLDFKNILSHAEQAGVKNAVIELDLSANPYKALEKSLKFLREIY